MKKLFIFVLSVVISFSVLNPAFGEEKSDAILAARFFAINEIAQVTGTALYGIMNESEYEYRELYFWFIPGKGIVKLEDEGGNEILSLKDQPIHQLPFPEEGAVYHLGINAYAYDVEGDYIASGSGNLSWPKENDTIIVTIWPGKQEQFEKFELPSNVDPEAVYMEIGDSQFYYNEIWEGFQFWYNPIIGNQEYTIWSDGMILTRGNFDPVTGEIDKSGVPQGNGFNFNLPTGVQMVDLSKQSITTFRNITLSGETEMDGETVEAQVYLVKSPDDYSSIYVDAEDVKELEVTVYGIADDGEMDTILPRTIYNPIYGYWHWGYYSYQHSHLIFVVTKIECDDDGAVMTFSAGSGKG